MHCIDQVHLSIFHHLLEEEWSEKIQYDIPEMENYLKETYGITVYQEQVMQLSQSLQIFLRVMQTC